MLIEDAENELFVTKTLTDRLEDVRSHYVIANVMLLRRKEHLKPLHAKALMHALIEAQEAVRGYLTLLEELGATDDITPKGPGPNKATNYYEIEPRPVWFEE